MGYLNNLFQAVRGKSIASEGAVRDVIVGKKYHADRAYAALVNKNVSWVYAMIDRNAKTMADQCLRLYSKKPTPQSKSRFSSKAISESQYRYLRKSPHLQKFVSDKMEVEEITDHPFLDTIHRGGGHYTRFDLFYLLTSSLDTTGNGYWLKERDATGTVIDIWPLLPQLVTPIPDKNNFLSHYEYGVARQKIKVPVKNMVHYKYASLKHPFLGSGPLEAGVEAADLGIAMNDYEVAMFQNGGTPDMVLSFPVGVQKDNKEIKRIQREFRRRFTTPGNAGRMAVATEGAEFKPFSLSPKDMSYLQGRKWSREELAGIFGVPMSFLVLDGVLKANVLASMQLYMRMTIKPKLTTTEEVMNEQLLPDYDENLFVAYDNPVPEDEEQRLKEIEVKTSTKYSSINELRSEDGLDPVEWGDEPVQPEPIQILPEKHKKKVKQTFPALEMPSANFIPHEFVTEMEAFFKRQGRTVMGHAENAEFKAVKVAEDIVGPWFNLGFWDEALTETIRPFVRASILTAGTRALQNIAPDSFFDTSDPRLIGAMQRRIPSIRGINRFTQELVRRQVVKGIALGESGNDIQKRIRNIFKVEEDEDVGRYRAVRIARTETIWAFNEGAVIAYKQSGVVTGTEWLTAEDERVCQWCGPMDGTVQTLGQNYFDKGDEFTGNQGGVLRFGLESVQHPPLHPQCRCSLAPIV